MTFRRGMLPIRADLLVVLGILAVAAVGRLVRLDLMEFKADEAEACRLALHALGYHEPGVGAFFPTEGLRSSVSVPNPPLFVYLVALPLAVVRSPIAVAAAIASANVAAVGICYVVGARIYSRFVGVVSSLLLALSPWSVVFSRKIWAQDLLPLTSALFLLELHALLVGKKPRTVATLIVIVAAATQLHFSAAVLVPVLLAALVLRRDVVSKRWLAVGLGAAVALYLPFLLLHSGTLLHSHAHSASTPPTLPHRLANTAHLTAAISSADLLSSLVGSQTSLAEPIGLLLAAAALAGLATAAARARGTPRGNVRALLLVWYLLPGALLTVLPVTSYIHYFIVLLPLPFLGMAYVLETLTRRHRIAAVVLAAAACAYFGAVDVGLLRKIAAHGGAVGDYGVAYRFDAEVVHELLRQGGRGTISVRPLDPSQGGAFRFLLWNADPDRRPTSKAQRRYLVFDTLRSAPAAVEKKAVLRVGPLLVSEMAPQRAQSAPR